MLRAPLFSNKNLESTQRVQRSVYLTVLTVNGLRACDQRIWLAGVDRKAVCTRFNAMRNDNNGAKLTPSPL